jgi:1-deoxy-D-xylulose-5-phosphate synthase
VNKKTTPGYTEVFSNTLRKLGKKDNKIVAITAAMVEGTGCKLFSKYFPSRFFDVGIAEEHAVTFSAGLAAAGLKPVFAVYSSFLQRAYDQILHDVCIQDLPVVFAIDRAGLVGNDGETHQGIFDLSYLGSIPNMTVMAPKNEWELVAMLEFALAFEHPIAIRYPRGEAYQGLSEFKAPIQYGTSEIIYEERKIALIALGTMVTIAEQVREELRKEGLPCTLINARFAKPLDEDMLCRMASSHQLLVTMEENVQSGGFGEHVVQYLDQWGGKSRILNISIPDVYVEHGNVEVLRKEIGIDSKSIVKRILEEYEGEA